MLTIIVLLVLLLIIALYVHTKVGLYRREAKAVSSPISRALADLVAVAGGIYLSLALLISFLKLQVAGIISVGQFQVDPLAIIALTVALVQPLLLSVWQRLKGSR